MTYRLIVLLAGLAVGACSVSPPPARMEPNYQPVWPEVQEPATVSSGSLFRASHNLALFDDRRAHAVGDIITIRLEESTRSSKSAETSIKKDTGQSITNPTVLGNLVRGSTPDLGSINSSTEFSGEGESDQSNSLSGTISAVVARILPNGLLQIQGEKWFQLNRGEEYVRVSGLLRVEDIGPDNSVSSRRLADARIAYSGTGALAQSNRPGWLTRFFLGNVNPF